MQKNTPTTDIEIKTSAYVSPEYRRLQKAVNTYYAALNKAIYKWTVSKEGKRLEAAAEAAKVAYENHRIALMERSQQKIPEGT